MSCCGDHILLCLSASDSVHFSKCPISFVHTKVYVSRTVFMIVEIKCWLAHTLNETTGTLRVQAIIDPITYCYLNKTLRHVTSNDYNMMWWLHRRHCTFQQLYILQNSMGRVTMTSQDIASKMANTESTCYVTGDWPKSESHVRHIFIEHTHWQHLKIKVFWTNITLMPNIRLIN